LFFSQFFVEGEQGSGGFFGEGEEGLDQVVVDVFGGAADGVDVELERFVGAEVAEEISQQGIDVDGLLFLRRAGETEHFGGDFVGGAAVDQGMKKAAVDADASACRRFQESKW